MKIVETIQILEVLENSKLAKNMSESEKTEYLVPIAFELSKKMNSEIQNNQNNERS